MDLSEVVAELRTRGYDVAKNFIIEDIRLKNSSVSLEKNGTTDIEVELIGGDDGTNAYYLGIRGKKYKINETPEGILIDRVPSELEGGMSGTLGANIKTGSTVTIGNIGRDTIALNGGNTTGTTVINVTYGNITRECYASVVDGNITFSTEYGTIDVIWLNTDNTIRNTPNPPVLSGMTPVKWTENASGWEATPVTTTSSDPNWYSYNAVSTRANSTNHTVDNTTSKWANAKNTTTGGDSYFVWIPRYAYRITYYSSETSTTPTGYYDGDGMWKNDTNRSLRCALDDGVETVTYNGNKYIVHPAFCNGTQYQNGTSKAHPYDLGEWDSQLSGFWVAKYEMSRTGATASSAGSATTFISVPNVQSAENMTIGDVYTKARSYDSSKDSHLMKKSEWGAVAYLTHSQYGRNGNEIDVNNSSTCITGNGGGSTSASSASGTTNAYNTLTGSKASTTGNVYGIYDMSGGGYEYVALFNNTDTNNYESIYGSSFAAITNSSNKYATKYYNETSTKNGNIIIYACGKIGDSTKEVNKGGSSKLSSTTRINNFFGDSSYLSSNDNPFILHGGLHGSSSAGIFCYNTFYGGGDGSSSFRTVLCP